MYCIVDEYVWREFQYNLCQQNSSLLGIYVAFCCAMLKQSRNNIIQVVLQSTLVYYMCVHVQVLVSQYCYETQQMQSVLAGGPQLAGC